MAALHLLCRLAIFGAFWPNNRTVRFRAAQPVGHAVEPSGDVPAPWAGACVTSRVFESNSDRPKSRLPKTPISLQKSGRNFPNSAPGRDGCDNPVPTPVARAADQTSVRPTRLDAPPDGVPTPSVPAGDPQAFWLVNPTVRSRVAQIGGTGVHSFARSRRSLARVPA